MSKAITFSRVFPKYHQKEGNPTYFVEKIWKSLETIGYSEPCFFFSEHQGLGDVISGRDYNNCLPKHHTIRAGNRWKVGDKFSPRVWSGKPYNSKQITIAPDIEIKKVWDFEINEIDVKMSNFFFGHDTFKMLCDDVAKNDGLSVDDFLDWFQFPKPFKGQIICWSDAVSY